MSTNLFPYGTSFRSAEIRALSWKNPYGPLMLPPQLKKETRTWSTKYRGLVLLCSSQQNYSLKEVEETSGIVQMKRIYGMLDREGLQANHLLRGKAFAIGNLVDCHKMRIDEANECFVGFKENLFVHVYRNVTPIEPFEFKGRQGWSTLTEEIKAKIKILSI